MLTVNVTESHISKGKRLNPKRCALSLALTEALGTSYAVSVGNVYYRFPEYGSEIDLPKAACDFRAAFDNELPVAPFTFEMADPRE